MARYCPVVGHGSSRYLERAWHCNHGDCGGIQAWRHHLEEQHRDGQLRLLAEEHRWQRALGLPLTPLGPHPDTAPLTSVQLRRLIARESGIGVHYLPDGGAFYEIEKAKGRAFETARRRIVGDR